MRTIALPLLARLVGVLAAVVAAAGLSLELWCAADRAHTGPRSVSSEAATNAVFDHPSAAAFSRLARVDGAAGNAKGAAFAAAAAARIQPSDPVLAAEADRTVDAAVRAEVLSSARPVTAFAALLLVVLGSRAWRRRREARALMRTLTGARGRIRLVAEGSRPAVGEDVMVDELTRSIVLDAELPPELARLRRPPPAVVYLSNSSADRTIRLSPRSDVRSGAVRWRIEGDTLATISAAPGRWRVLLRAGPVVLAESALLVTPSARRRVA